MGRELTIKEIEINERIRDSAIRVIADDGTQLGIMSAAEANRLADQKNLDLVKINPGATPPVCKIMNYGKYKFETAKREKETKRNQKVAEIKEIRLSMTIDIGDINTKSKHAIKFLQSGDKVKVSIRMRGRQQAHADIGIRTMEEFLQLLGDICQVEKRPTRESSYITMILAPKK